jgi:putative transport protein
MTIDFVTLLHQSDSLLLFVVLAFGLLLGKVRIGNFQIGNTIGVLFTALLFGQMGFQFSTSTENVGFMLFIFCVGIEAGPHFFSVFLRDGIHYITLTLVILLSALLLTVGLAKFFNLAPACRRHSGRLTSTPALVGAQDALRSGLLNLPHQTDMQSVLDNMGIGYALTYLVGLVGLMLVVRYLPSPGRLDLNTEAQKIARERGSPTARAARPICPSSAPIGSARSSPPGSVAAPCAKPASIPTQAAMWSGFAATAFWLAPMVTPSFRKGTRSPWWATPRATRS